VRRCKKDIILYLKVFVILFLLGFVIPVFLDFILKNVIIRIDEPPSGNYLFVMDNIKKNRSFFDVFLEILGKVIEF
jgi:hypothetical protein